MASTTHSSSAGISKPTSGMRNASATPSTTNDSGTPTTPAATDEVEETGSTAGGDRFESALGRG